MEQFSKDCMTIRLEETESTNLYLRQMIKDQNLKEGSMVVADYQTGGRGQVGNTWFSSKGENLLFSLLLQPQNVRANEQFIISRVVSLAVQHALSRFADDIRIKWPNDIYWKDNKIAGMLIENDINGYYITNVVIGIGININQPEFPSQLPNPVSLRQVTGKVWEREDILDIFKEEFFIFYSDFKKGNIKAIEDLYMRNLYWAVGYHTFEDRNGRFMAKIEQVLPSGNLVLKLIDSEETRIYAFKEVEFKVEK